MKCVNCGQPLTEGGHACPVKVTVCGQISDLTEEEKAKIRRAVEEAQRMLRGVDGE